LIVRYLSYAVVVVFLGGCNSFFFYPHKIHYQTPADSGMIYRSVQLREDAEPTLSAWFLPAKEERGVVLYLHGNAENISTHFRSVYWLPDEGYSVFALDYRGYGLSEGVPTFDGLQRDIERALEYLSLTAPDKLIVLGQSLGGAMAIPAVARSKYRQYISGVIIDSAFSDFRAVTREKLELLFLTRILKWPLSGLVSNEFRPLDFVADLSPLPTLFLHGTEDTVVLPHHSEMLYQKAREPKNIWLIQGAGHTQAIQYSHTRTGILAFLDKLPLKTHHNK
jgi:hypothetical protein